MMRTSLAVADIIVLHAIHIQRSSRQLKKIIVDLLPELFKALADERQLTRFMERLVSYIIPNHHLAITIQLLRPS